jgi:hypothetical protein
MTDRQIKELAMTIQIRSSLIVLVCLVLACARPLPAQQKGQWVPGQFGLNAGVVPDPGFTYANLTLNYSASQLNNSSANAVPGITGDYGFWVTENILYYVPKAKFLGAHFAPYVVLSFANGSLTASGPLGVAPFGVDAGGEGFADTYVEPVNLAWHFSRADINVGYGFTAPTGRYSSAPGTTNNVGSGYWGNNLTSGTTVYLTKNKGTTANLFTDWEIHGKKEGTNLTPGQAFTMEWGFGQVIPLDRQFHRLFQFGVIGYDQWQVSYDRGTTPLGLPARLVPFYSVHAVGLQTNLIIPAQGLTFTFKYEPEYSAKARPQGRTLVFSGVWNLRFPKEQAPKP